MKYQVLIKSAVNTSSFSPWVSESAQDDPANIKRTVAMPLLFVFIRPIRRQSIEYHLYYFNTWKCERARKRSAARVHKTGTKSHSRMFPAIRSLCAPLPFSILLWFYFISFDLCVFSLRRVRSLFKRLLCNFYDRCVILLLLLFLSVGELVVCFIPNIFQFQSGSFLLLFILHNISWINASHCHWKCVWHTHNIHENV